MRSSLWLAYLVLAVVAAVLTGHEHWNHPYAYRDTRAVIIAQRLAHGDAIVIAGIAPQTFCRQFLELVAMLRHVAVVGIANHAGNPLEPINRAEHGGAKRTSDRKHTLANVGQKIRDMLVTHSKLECAV